MTSRGTLLLDATLGASWWNDGRSIASSKTALYAQPALLYFPRDKLAVGAQLGGELGKVRDPFGGPSSSDYRVWFGVVAAFEVPLGRRVSFMVMPGLAYLHSWVRREAVELPAAYLSFQALPASSPQRMSIDSMRVSLALPLVLHFSERFGVGVGPDFWYDWLPRNHRNFSEGGSLASTAAYGVGAAFPERRPFEVGLRTTLYAAF